MVGSTEHAYGHGFRGNGIRIAIIDTGIDLAHEDLAATTDVALGKNCVGAGPPQDGYGHGTHVAGTAASPLNGVGLLGVAPESHLVPVKVFDDAGNSSEAMVLCGLDHIIGLATDGDPTNDVQVANMSFGEDRAWGDCGNDALHAAICAASAAGITLVGGAGNSAVNANTFVPAAFPEVISVSALADFDGHPGGLKGCAFVADLFWYECDDTLAFFSNWGKVDVMAPGVAIQSTWPGNQYKVISGTSMATPHVAGVAALMKAANPALSPAQIMALMKQTGECPNQAYADADGISGCAGQGHGRTTLTARRSRWSTRSGPPRRPPTRPGRRRWCPGHRPSPPRARETPPSPSAGQRRPTTGVQRSAATRSGAAPRRRRDAPDHHGTTRRPTPIRRPATE